MTPLIFLDTETTGLRPDIHTIWDIAWVTAIHDSGDDFKTLPDGQISVDNGTLTIHRRFEARTPLYFGEMASADHEALNIGHYDERHRDGLMEREAIIAELTADIARLCHSSGDGSPPPHLVGANPGFDLSMLCANWVGWPDHGEGLFHYQPVCVKTLAAGKLGIAPPYNSSVLMSGLGIVANKSTRHTAMGDVEWTIAAYAAVYNLEVIDERGTDSQ